MSPLSARTTVILSWIATVTFSCADQPGRAKITDSNFYSSNGNRMAAEWEPAKGTMIVWPLCIPYKLVVELAKDNHLFTLVKNEASKKEAIEWYTKWGIDTANNSFIYAPQGVDAWWVRDWGPGAVFTSEGQMKLGDGKYIYSTPVTRLKCDDSLYFLYMTADHKIIKTETDDTATRYLGKGLGMQVLDLPFVSTGGNVLTDGLGTAFSTCILLNENKFFGVSNEKFFKLNGELLGLNRYNIVSNFEKEGIQHIDCYLKLLDEERILVLEPPSDHEWSPVYENIVQNELKKLKTPYGRPYQIFRIKSGRYRAEELAAYTNSLIVNKTIYVPLFRIKEDSAALQTYGELMPGYTIKGFEFDLSAEPLTTPEMKKHYTDYGWQDGDALHCRVRAVWDPQMVFITVKRIDTAVDVQQKDILYATIIDYSKKGLVDEATQVYWRLTGETAWKATPLQQIANTDHFFAEIPFHQPGRTIEYFVSATSNSGRKETQPRTAPKGTYQFRIK